MQSNPPLPLTKTMAEEDCRVLQAELIRTDQYLQQRRPSHPPERVQRWRSDRDALDRSNRWEYAMALLAIETWWGLDDRVQDSARFIPPLALVLEDMDSPLCGILRSTGVEAYSDRHGVKKLLRWKPSARADIVIRLSVGPRALKESLHTLYDVTAPYGLLFVTGDLVDDPTMADDPDVFTPQSWGTLLLSACQDGLFSPLGGSADFRYYGPAGGHSVFCVSLVKSGTDTGTGAGTGTNTGAGTGASTGAGTGASTGAGTGASTGTSK